MRAIQAAEEGTEEGYQHGYLEERMISLEQRALADFALRLGSCNFIEEPGIADEGSTRQEAKLLMSLLSSPPKFDDHDWAEPVSSSESEHSYMSDSSFSRREAFSFTCPSLSLERSTSSYPANQALSHRQAANRRSHSRHGEASSPAVLLGRPLKVDDRDAYRLSADAMARNVLQSFQKAVNWRMEAWIRALSRVLVEKERHMLEKKVPTEELKSLLKTSEAMLVTALRQVQGCITVTGSSTRFRVLPERVEAASSEEEERAAKRQRVDGEPSDLEECYYQYRVAHALMFDCTLEFQTPAGYAEITLNVPGTMEGVFQSSENGTEGEMTCVLVNIDTSILASMVEQGCRKIVRAVVESVMDSPEPEYKSCEAEESELVPDNSLLVASATETPCRPTPSLNSRAAIVTPRSLFSDLYEATERARESNGLVPIPENFDAREQEPRRISPQPGSPSFGDSYHFLPRTPYKSSPSEPCLVSPPLNESEMAFHEVPANGPSLPLLVEVACRAMESN